MNAKCDRCDHGFRVLYPYVVCPFADCQGILIPDEEEREIDVPVPTYDGDTLQDVTDRVVSMHERSLKKLSQRTQAPQSPDFREWETEILDPHSGYDAVLDAWQERSQR